MGPGPALERLVWYSGQAVKLADGDGFVDFFYGGPTAEHGPLTPLLLAPVSWMDDPVRWQRTVMTVIGLAVVVAVGLLARRVGGWWVGVVAVALAAIYPNLWMNDSLVMSEAPSALVGGRRPLAGARLGRPRTCLDRRGDRSPAARRSGWPRWRAASSCSSPP